MKPHHLHLDFKRFTLQIGLAGFGLMVGYLTLFWEGSQTVLPLGSASNPVDFYAEQLDGRHFGLDGKLQQTLIAERMTHYRDSNESLLIEPRVTSIGNDGRRWYGESREATLFGDESVQLRRDVVINEIDGSARLTTERLNWHLPSQRVDTDLPVTLVQTGQTLHGTGLRADLEKERSELLHDVEGLHELR